LFSPASIFIPVVW